MLLDHEVCYQALKAHDARFDGVFFVGVVSTGIYCRTVCPTKTPKRENCRFFASAAAAEQFGLRPCLRCRPELAPGSAQVDSARSLAARAASRIEHGGMTDRTVDDLAAELGVTGRHLRRVFRAEYGVTPIALAQTQRLLTAKHLLTDTRLTVTEIAFAASFGSLRRFNALFGARYRMPPSKMRRRPPTAENSDSIRCLVGFRPPYQWASMCNFLNARGAAGVESVAGGAYARTARVGACSGWLRVAPDTAKSIMSVEISTSLVPVFPAVIARIRRLFDLACDPAAIAIQMGVLAVDASGLRVPGAFDTFEIAVRAILGQQVSVKAASTLAARLANSFGDPIETPWPDLNRLVPTAARVAAARPSDIAALGIVQSRSAAIVALAAEICEGRLALDPGADVDSTMRRLCSIAGIGEWTAQYIAMRCLSWPDAFPHGDLGIARALGETDPCMVLQLAERWRPWRAYAAMHLWKRLEGERK